VAPVVDGIDLSRTFTADEVFELHAKGKLRKIAVQGYVAQASADGTCRFVPWWKSNRLAPRDERKGETPRARVYTTDADVSAYLGQGLPEIKKRTPRERTASLMMRLMQDVRATGRLALSDDEIRAIVGESWKAGQPMAADDVRKIAAYYLGVAEVDGVSGNETRVRLNRKERRRQERLQRQEERRWHEAREKARL